MKPILFSVLLFLSACAATQKSPSPALPNWMKGGFEDDYGIRYTISDSLFTMEGAAKYIIVEWNQKEQYLLTRNAADNKTAPGLFTRIDYMQFTGMEPFLWGYCFTVYEANNLKEAAKAAPADRTNPRKGCNGYPFSRMKRGNF